MYIASKILNRPISVVIILIVILLVFQISVGETLYPPGYNIASQYSISSSRIVIGDTLIITRTITNDETFSTSGLYFSDNLPPRFAVIEASMNINGANITFESHDPLPNLFRPEYDNYTWVINDPNDDVFNNVVNPGDTFEFQLKLSCDSIGEYLLPLHTTVFYGNNQGFFSTSDSILIEFVFSADIDTIPPQFIESCPLDTTIECGVIPDPPVMTATDNYDPVIDVAFNEVIEGNIITRTWTATDDAGNSVQCVQAITVSDTISPVIACSGNILVECGASIEPDFTGYPTVSDNCNGSPILSYNDVITGNIIARTWTATDDAGNSVQCAQVLTIEDINAPEFVEACPQDMTAECGSVPDPPVMTASDDCDPEVVVVFNQVIENNIINRTWTATDEAGNGVQCVQVLTVEDTRAPEFVEACPPDMTAEDGSIPDPPVMTAIDDCDPDVGVSYSEVIDNNIITRTWTATDNAGNSNRCIQIINIETGSLEFSRISGQIMANEIGLYNAYVKLFDSGGDFLGEAAADENGFYSFEELPDGRYTVELAIPLGFIPITDTTVEVSITGNNVEVNFELTNEINTVWSYNYWWWLRQFTYIQRGGVYAGLAEITPDEVEELSQLIFNHFYNRDDGFEIQIDSVTYIDNPARSLTFEELSNTFLGATAVDGTTQIKRSLRANMLNIASGKLSQYAIVSVDGATASQALTYLTSLYLAGGAQNLYTANVNLQRMHMRVMIPAGVIPLTTPNIVYKEEGGSNNEMGLLPDGFSLGQNYPNPFNPVTEIRFGLAKASNVRLEIFNMIGQKVAIAANGYYLKGYHTVIWDGSRFGSGVYLYRIEADGFSDLKKMVLLK